jgi:DNA-binding transcriptional LysR family regulator
VGVCPSQPAATGGFFVPATQQHRLGLRSGERSGVVQMIRKLYERFPHDPIGETASTGSTVRKEIGAKGSVELRHLRYVVAAAEYGSFRRAAKALNIQESAISRRIRDLEDSVGASLFVRHHGGVFLTHAGQRFVIGARNALKQVGYATLDAASVGRGEIGTVRVGIFSSLASGFLSELLYAYVQGNPTIRTELIEGAPSAHVAAIQRRHLDVAFLAGKPAADGCDTIHLWNEHIFVVLPKDDALTRERKIEWRHLRGRNFIVGESYGPETYNYLAKHLGELGHRPCVERYSLGCENLMHLVAMGKGLTLTSEAATATRFPGVVYRRLATEALPFSAIWYARNDNPGLRRLLSLARTMLTLLPYLLILSALSDYDCVLLFEEIDLPLG